MDQQALEFMAEYEECKVVAALCVGPNSVYKRLPGVDCYDEKRDVRNFNGDLPIVAHPPCRSWSAFLAHQAKPPAGEKELALLCVEKLRQNGGVLEHPAHSRLFKAAKLPGPGETNGGEWTISVDQYWWGFPSKKTTWLCFFGIKPSELPEFPWREHDGRKDGQVFQRLSKRQRAHTVDALAIWLTQAARNATRKPTEQA